VRERKSVYVRVCVCSERERNLDAGGEQAAAGRAARRHFANRRDLHMRQLLQAFAFRFQVSGCGFQVSGFRLRVGG